MNKKRFFQLARERSLVEDIIYLISEYNQGINIRISRTTSATHSFKLEWFDVLMYVHKNLCIFVGAVRKRMRSISFWLTN